MRNRIGCWRTSAKVSRVKVYFEWMSASQIVAVKDIQLLLFGVYFKVMCLLIVRLVFELKDQLIR